VEVFLEGQEFTSELAPELVGVLDGLFVQRMVLVKVFEMSLASAFLEESLGDVVSIYFVSCLTGQYRVRDQYRASPTLHLFHTLVNAG